VVWEIVFLLVILKIPIVYLCCVVWYAIRAEPKPEPPVEPALVPAPVDLGPRAGWRPLLLARRKPGPGPHGSPVRTHVRKAAFARAAARR